MMRAFTKNFEGTYKRPATIKDIEACAQKLGKCKRKY
jgi:hypothetical protein